MDVEPKAMELELKVEKKAEKISPRGNKSKKQMECAEPSSRDSEWVLLPHTAHTHENGSMVMMIGNPMCVKSHDNTWTRI